MGCSDCDTAGRLTPGVLTSDQQLALIFETGSVQSLLRHGVDQRHINADIDPVLTTLSIGVEKLMKLTWACWKWRPAAAGRPGRLCKIRATGSSPATN